MNDSQEAKLKLRQTLLKKRLSMPALEWQEKSNLLCEHLQEFEWFSRAKTILTYFSFRQEPDLSKLFTLNRRWGFPRITGQSLIWHHWQPADPLVKNPYGILEPHPTCLMIEPAEVDLILVPAVAGDFQGYRLGYGGGFYDRLLSLPEWSKIPTIGIIFDFAYLSQLPVEPWDKPLQAICTETGLKIITSVE